MREIADMFATGSGDVPPGELQALREFVAEATGIPYRLLTSRLRTSEVSKARHIVYWLLKRRGYSLVRIGRAMGRDHTTVRYGIRAVHGNKLMQAAAVEIEKKLSEVTE